MITTSKLTKHYRGGDRPALIDAEIRIRPGSIAAILGPNGSGKTTLLQLLSGQLFPTSGEIRIGERAIRTDDLVPYFAVAHEGNNIGESRIKDYLGFARARPGWSEAAYERLEQRFGIANRRKRVHKLSTGQQSSFAISLAIASGAPVIVVDEAHTGMDVPKRLALYEELVRVNAEQARTVLIASHNVGELERVVEDVIVLKEGRVVEQTTAEALARRFARIVGPADAVAATAGSRVVRARRDLGAASEWVVDIDAQPMAGPNPGVVVTPISFQDAFVALIDETPSPREGF